MKSDAIMTTSIAGVIESYFRASNADDIEALVECFSPDATVVDENQTHRGTAEIKAWATNVRTKYEFKTEVLRATESSGVTIVTAKVSGSFLGSPVNLDFKFAVSKNKITSLHIG
jgi:ketosteroid isomerase-like protein